MTRSSLGRTWHIVAFVVAVIALVLQLILILLGQNILDSSSVTSGLPEQVRRYFSYFTIQANFLVAISMFMLVTGRTGTQLFRVLRLASLIGIVVTGVVAAVALPPSPNYTTAQPHLRPAAPHRGSAADVRRLDRVRSEGLRDPR